MVSSFWNSPLSKVTKRVSAPEKSPPPPPPSRSAKSSPPPPPTSKFWSSPLSKVTTRVSAPEKSPPSPPTSKPKGQSSWDRFVAQRQASKPPQIKTPVIRKPSSGSSGRVTGTTISSPPARGETLEIVTKTPEGETSEFISRAGTFATREEAARAGEEAYQKSLGKTSAFDVDKAFRESGIVASRVLVDPDSTDFVEARIPPSGFRYSPDLNRKILEKEKTGAILTGEEKEYVLQAAQASQRPLSSEQKTEQEEQERIQTERVEAQKREEEQERLEQASRDVSFADSIKEEPRPAPGRIMERMDASEKAKGLLANLGVKGRVARINQALASGAAGIQEKAFASKAKVGSEIEELVRQREGLSDFVTVPDFVLRPPPLMTIAERQNLSIDSFILDRDKALFKAGDEVNRFMVEQQLGSILDEGVLLGDVARDLGDQLRLGDEAEGLRQEFGLGEDFEIPESIVGKRREELEAGLGDLAKRFADSDARLQESAKKAHRAEVGLKVPSDEDLKKIKPTGFFTGTVRGLEEFRDGIKPVGFSSVRGIKISPQFEEQVLGIRDKTLLKDFGTKEVGAARFVASLPLGLARFGQLGETLAQENVELLKARLRGETLSEADLAILSPTITGVRKGVEKLSDASVFDPLSKIKLTTEDGVVKLDKELMEEQRAERTAIATGVGVGLATKFKDDPFGFSGEIAGTAIILGAAKGLTGAIKTKFFPKPGADLQAIARTVDPKFLRSTKPFMDKAPQIKQIGVSELEAATRKFLTTPPKDVSRLATITRKANLAAQKNIDRLFAKKVVDFKLPPKTRPSFVVAEKKPFAIDSTPAIKTRLAVQKFEARQEFLKELAFKKQVPSNIFEKLSPSEKAFLQSYKASLAKDTATISQRLKFTKLSPEQKSFITGEAVKQKQQALKTAIERELFERDKSIALKLQTEKVKSIQQQLRLEDIARTEFKKLSVEQELNKLKPLIAEGKRSMRDSISFQKFEALTAEKLRFEKALELLKKGKDPFDTFLGKPVTPKPPTPPKPSVPAESLGFNVQKDGTILLTRTGTVKTTDPITRVFTPTKPVDTTRFLDSIRLTSRVAEPKTLVIKPVKIVENVQQASKNFGMGALSAYSAFLQDRFKRFAREEDELIQIARNIGVGDIPTQTDFLRTQQPALIKTPEISIEQVEQKTLEGLNEQLLEAGLRNLRDTSRGVTMERTKEQEMIDTKTRLKEKEVLKDLEDIKTRQDTRVRESLRDVTQPRTRQDTLVKTKLLEKLFTKTRTDVRLVPKPVPKISPTKPTKIRQPTPQKIVDKLPKIIPFPKLEASLSGKNKKQAYNFYEVRGIPRGSTVRGKRFVGNYPLNKGLNKTAEIVSNNPSRTIKYYPKGTTRTPDDLFFKRADEYRPAVNPPKIKGKPKAKFLVEKTKFAIATPGEKAGITRKGLETLRKQKISEARKTARGHKLNLELLGLTKTKRRKNNARKK